MSDVAVHTAVRHETDDVEHAQLSALQRLREERNAGRVDETLVKLRRGAENGANLIPLMLDAVRAYVSVGEVCQALVPAFGVYREKDIPPHVVYRRHIGALIRQEAQREARPQLDRRTK